ncbi:MAG: hypothetical protein KKA64_00890 [Nanoarchaeota archaeon]|nr:hypothetical protein [Nanoarchaeota archaeon]
MKKIELMNELNKYPVFTLKTVKEIIGKNREYAKLVVYRLKKEKLIFEIERNKYTSQKDPIAVISSIIWPSYISCWSALRYYNLTEQLPEIFFVITTRAKKKRIIEFGNIKIVFIKTIPKYFFGYKKEIYNGFEVFIADKEKALIDSSLFKKASFLEICSIIKNSKEDIDFNLLLNYLIRTKNKALIKRFGFLLENLTIDVHRLEKLIDFKYIPLDYSIGVNAKMKRDKKWKVIKNVDI